MLSEEEFMEKYGSAKVKFSSYYKFIFSYRGTTEDGSDIMVSVGGSGDDIYKNDVDANKEYSVLGLFPSYGMVSNGSDIIDEFNSWY